MLGIDVSDPLLDSWIRWFAPDPQLFVVPTPTSGMRVARAEEVTAEIRDTFRLWGVDDTLSRVWLTEGEFMSMPRTDRAALVRAQAAVGRGAVPTVRRWADVVDAGTIRSQADGHRFVWWRSILEEAPAEVLSAVVSLDRLPSRHREVAERTWRGVQRTLPGARRLAGTWPTGSGANCFGTVMAAAGMAEASECWVMQASFDQWLRSSCRPGGRDEDAGTVLVWRRTDGVAAHAAVAIGDGWVLEKPSQEWHSPRAVVAVRDAIRTTRAPGQHLERWTIGS